MTERIAAKQLEVTALCRQHHVRWLAVFGSVLREDFDGSRSDVDFLVEFERLPMGQNAPNYFALKASLASLFERSVDLVIWRDVVNPYIRSEIEATHQELYAA